LGRFAKLFGNTAFYVAAIAEALSTANGFLPVRVLLPAPLPTKFFVPELFSLSLIILLATAEFILPSLDFSLGDEDLLDDEDVDDELLEEDRADGLTSGSKSASNLNYSIL
jgi:hypothetical protein